MDLLTKWNQTKHEIFESASSAFSASSTSNVSMPEMVKNLTDLYMQIWWTRDSSLPEFANTPTPAEQATNNRQLEKMVDGLMYELKHMPQAAADRDAWQKRLRGSGISFACTAFNLQQRHLEFIESSGMVDAAQAFARMARQFDPQIRGEDIYQASRNVMTANFMQLLLGLPVEVTPSVFAYSMLYPYTDNYLDDPAISSTTKLAFNHRFQARLQGETIRPANQHEAVISDLVGMIEGQFDRARYPLVYESLLAIHAAQARSLKLVVPGASPFEYDVLGISFEKGGTSVLADGYLVAGWLTPAQAKMMFGYGAFTQLMDDLEDVIQDAREGRLTIFSQTANHWPLDGVTNHTIHFGRAIFQDLSAFQSPAVGPLKELISRAIDPLLIDTMGQISQLYSKNYLREMERHIPFQFKALKKQRDRLNRQKVTLEKLVNTFFLNS